MRQPTVTDAAGGRRGIDDAARQLAERTEDLQRVTAEYANYRRRVERDRVQVVDQAAERFAGQLFPIVDDIERARDHGDLTGAFKVGRRPRRWGCSRASAWSPFGKPGDPFDPSLHEAVLHDTSPGGDRADRHHGAAAGLPARRPGAAHRDGRRSPTRSPRRRPRPAEVVEHRDGTADDEPGGGPAVG